jgi:hypothetical protein
MGRLGAVAGDCRPPPSPLAWMTASDNGVNPYMQ